MEKTRDFKVLNGFWIKIIAIISMTFDHVGYFLQPHGNLHVVFDIFRVIGRLSFPLFIFLLVEGVIHTKNTRNYFIRLSLLALAFLIGQLFAYFVIDKSNKFTSPAVDLLLTAALVYFLKRKDWFSLLGIIPIAWALISMFVRNYETVHLTSVKWWPFFLRPDYTLFGPLLGIGFYYANDLAKLFLNSKDETKNFLGTSYERTTKNVISAIFLILLTISFTFIDRNALNLCFNIPWQIYSLFAFIPILLYNGKRGYNAKWFQYGCYIYFPAHLILIYLIFSLI